VCEPLQWLKDKGHLEKCGRVGYVSGLADAAPSVFAFSEYLGVLIDKAHRRWMLAKSVELAGLAKEATVSLDDTRARLSELFDDLHEWIMVLDPPEGGIPFHRPEFRASVRRMVEALKPDLVIIDPWSHVAVEDAAKDVVDKIAEIRSCFPPGDACPALLIVAHTKKPRAEDVKRGRALAYLISGSVALVNTARCVFMLLPWSDELEDDRIYWSCCKLNDGAMYPASVWRRRFGTFFAHDEQTDPTTWGEDEDEARRSISREMIATVFKESKRAGMKKGELVRGLVARFPDVGASTAWRAMGRDGYAMEWLSEAAGVVALRKGGD